MQAASRPFFPFKPVLSRPRRTVLQAACRLALTGLPVCSFLYGAHPVAAQPATVKDTANWTTHKGDNQRSGASAAQVPLPLSLMWRYTSEGPARPYKASPLVIGIPGQQRVYFASGNMVYCINAQTGESMWTNPARLSTSVITAPTLLTTERGDMILVATQGGRVSALRAADGGRAWEADARSTIGAAGPIVVNTPKGQRVIVAVSAGRLVAFTPDGQIDPEWEVKLGRYGTNPSSGISQSSNGSLLFMMGSDTKFYAIDVQKGVIAYTVQMPSQSAVTPVVYGEQVILCSTRLVQGIKAAGGQDIWSMNPRGEVLGMPATGKSQSRPCIFFGTANGLMYSVSTETGGILWKTDLQAAISGSPVYLSNMVVVGTRNGLLMAVNPNDGTVIWRYRLKTERALQPSTTAPATGPDGAALPGGGDDDSGLRIWGVTAGVSPVDGQLFALGDNASLYGFTSAAFDATPPLVVEPSLSLPDENDRITSLLLQPNTPQVVPGRGPMYFAVQLDDTGSGINPGSIQLSLDGVAVPAAEINFQAATGILTATILDTDKGVASFPDGLKNIELKVKDYFGNQLTYTASFLVDNTVPPPAAPADVAPAPGGEAPPPAANDGGGGF